MFYYDQQSEDEIFVTTNRVMETIFITLNRARVENGDQVKTFLHLMRENIKWEICL